MQTSMLLLLLSIIAVLKSQQCSADNKCPGNLLACAGQTDNVKKCDCLNNALADAGCTRCITVTTSNAATCLAFGLTSRIFNGSYDFKTCSACSNPPGDNFFPSKCAQAYINYADRLLPFNRKTPFISIPDACSAIYDFYTELGNCGGQGLNADSIKQTVCAAQAVGRYSICQCDGRGVSALGTKIIAAMTTLKQEIIDYFYELYGKAGKLGTVDIDTTRTYNCDDRVVVKFTGTFDGQQIKDAYAKYFGVDVSRVVVGINVQDEKVGGVCKTVVDFSIQTKRDELQATSATVQIKDGSGGGNNAGTLIISQFVILLCALIYFL